MSYKYKNYLYGAVACGVTSLCGVPALADDTELLLVNPGNNAASTPNVMFILDTSGSNTRSINKSSFHCQAAARQIEGIGSFSSTMVQYRSDLLGLAQTWQDLESGNFVDPVECQADSGIHGDGTAGEVYASALSGLLNPWTSNKLLEISWGSSPRNVSYTVFDGNYLNWRKNPTNVTLTRNAIMRTVVSTVLRSLDNLNVGIMRFNEDDGGVVLQSIKDLETNREQILDVIDGLDADGFTPLSEALYESALYWNGSSAYYGENVDQFATDPNALSSTDPNVYRSPISNACAKNYNVLLTDGEPNLDLDPPNLVAGLSGYTSLLERTGCNGTDEGACLDDIGEYLSLLDAKPDIPGLQNVTTHTIGFNIDLPILRDTAVASGGEYFLADDVESLTLALLQIVANINERSLSFAAPAVSVNTFNRTQNLNRLYLTVFGTRTNVHWPGNLKRYEINGAQIVDAAVTRP